jgi:hypothetical protein
VPPPTEQVVDKIDAFIDATRSIGSASSAGKLWFRGVSNAAHGLLPRLYRSSGTAGELVAIEREMLAQFKSRSQPYLDGGDHSPWGYLFIMQHYGVPTRLLDWSENALIGLYFSLSAAAAKGFPTDAAVWVLDAGAWNAATFPNMGSPGIALHADNKSLVNYGPDRDLDQMASGVAAMYALYNNPRVAAQRGVFTVFGREKDPMEAVCEADIFNQPVLTRLRIPQAALEAIYGELRLLGFRESMIYPDLTGLAKEIRTDQGLL